MPMCFRNLSCSVFMHRKSVFITRERESILPFIDELNNHGIWVAAQALFRYESLNFLLPSDKVEWIFFSSRNAVRFFFEKEFAGNVKYAAMGAATAAELSKHVEVSFVGADYDTQKTAIEFAKVAGESIILFPTGSNSLRTVQKVFPPSQVIEIACYRSTRIETSVGPHDAYVVLSPENARVILEDGSINRQAPFFVLGNPTALALRKGEISNIHFLPHGAHKDWARNVFSFL